MFLDRELAGVCRSLYAYPGDAPMTWDYLDQPGDDGICWSLLRTPHYDVVVLRGSVTHQDWFRDFLAMADPIDGGALGPVHFGFFRGMRRMWDQAKPMLRPGRTIVIGHSLGGARAQLLSGLMVLDGMAPAALVTFGAPKAGFDRLRQVLEAIPHRVGYRNGHVDNHEHDLVTNVPFTLLLHRYVHGAPVFDVYSSPPPDDEWGPFRYHHIQLYQEALRDIVSGVP